MRCYDLLKLKSLSDLQVVGGMSGLGKQIGWVYFADTVAIDDCINWVQENELFVITGKNINGDMDKLYKIIRLLSEKGIAGILINTGTYIAQIPQNVITLADTLCLPVFSLPWEKRLADVTKEICNAIIKSETIGDKGAAFLNNLLFDDSITNDEIAKLVLNTDFEFNKEAAIGIIKCSSPSANNTSSESSDSNLLSRVNRFLYSSIENYLKTPRNQSMAVLHNNSVVFLIHKSSFPQSSVVRDMLNQIQQHLQKQFGDFSVCGGIGAYYTSPLQYKTSYVQAKQACHIASVDSAFAPFAYYDDLGLYSLIASISDRQLGIEFYHRVFGKILEYDRSNHSSLLKTLRVFLYSQLNIQDAAQNMFIHKNTMKYRLSKIEDLLGTSFRESEQIASFIIAFKIEQFFSLQSIELEHQAVKPHGSSESLL